MSRQTRPGRADKNATAPAEEMIGLRVANAAQLRLSLVVQNVDWRWRKSHQNKNRTAPRLRTRETCGSESVPTGGGPPLAHASGYKTGDRRVYMQGLPLPLDRFGGSSGFGVALLLFGVAAQSLFHHNSPRALSLILPERCASRDLPRMRTASAESHRFKSASALSRTARVP